MVAAVVIGFVSRQSSTTGSPIVLRRQACGSGRVEVSGCNPRAVGVWRCEVQMSACVCGWVGVHQGF